ncbi:O-methyltransferase [Flavobacterium sp.]|uniref:O-methyltransferase n=1 Tax=Flavobacterium sp. TaxID=239 RepID=UPI0035B0D15B
MLQQIQSYLKFQWNATSEHGVHSPFVFDLVRNCFYDTTNYEEYEVLDNYRNQLLNDHNTIEVTDFGADSRVFKSNTREIAAIAKNAGISRKRAQLLFRLVRYFQPTEILEIGTSLGLATSALALGNKNSTITTLEGCPSTSQKSKEESQKFGFKNIEFITTEFSSYLNNLKLETLNKTNQKNFDCIYFDGNHSKKATLEYFETLLPSITNETIWIFDDIHWSQDMEEAWEIIKDHPKVTVTIDTFQWGLVFFRKEQNKEHFCIKTEQNLSSMFFEKIRI